MRPVGKLQDAGRSGQEPQGLRDNDVRRGEEYGDGGDDGEQREDDEAEPIDDHGGELPVVRHFGRLVLLAQLVGDDAQLLEDEGELAVRPQAGVQDSAAVLVTAQERMAATTDTEYNKGTLFNLRLNSFFPSG